MSKVRVETRDDGVRVIVLNDPERRNIMAPELCADLLGAVNATGEAFLSHTRIDRRYAIRLAIGHLRTTQSHVAAVWSLLRAQTAVLAAGLADGTDGR